MIGIALLTVSVRQHPTLLGMAFLAYTFGLRHAFDVDHIAAIDNTVRKLTHEQKHPMGVGFYFSLGHSTVVAGLTMVTAMSVHFLKERMPQIETVGSVMGPTVSGTFLLVIGCINLVVLAQILRTFMRMRGREEVHTDLESWLSMRGFMARLTKPLLRIVNKSWHAYPIGFLFGLGFDTATEIALLGISAVAAKNALPFTGVLSLPILFAAGMSLLDTADGIFMSTAYDWAFATPLRKVYYNLSVTGLGVLAAVFVGLVELAQVLVPALGLRGQLWNWIVQVNFGRLGYLLVALFVAVWVLSFGLWKFFHIEEHWQGSAGS
ncbi:HoxN/HupN/NixA family nickel/cobalt transporter [Alicyclobacillus cycloheptanicus]|nr:HoxN/HupN/NixA family nickel/cobalt transporter [Alicyclobacillus cycloheptanicus]